MNAQQQKRSGGLGIRVLEDLRGMIANGVLLPGQLIRQEALAERLDVSRLPVRQALEQLAAEGLVQHTPHVGYAVTRLDAFEFEQLFLLNELLEDAVLARIEKPRAVEVELLLEAMEVFEAAAASPEPVRMREANERFHFLIFGLSRMDLLVSELQRVWRLTAPYLGLSIAQHGARETMVIEHRAMFEAVLAGDGGEMSRLMEAHRAHSQWRLHTLLRQRDVLDR